MTAPAPRYRSIADYIDQAPAAGRPLLQSLYTLLQHAAPDAQEAIKWNTPFFIEPRFVYGFSAHKAYASFAPPASAMAHFEAELKAVNTTRGTIVLPYDQPLPEALLRQIAQYSVQRVQARTTDSFWE